MFVFGKRKREMEREERLERLRAREAVFAPDPSWQNRVSLIFTNEGVTVDANGNATASTVESWTRPPLVTLSVADAREAVAGRMHSSRLVVVPVPDGYAVALGQDGAWHLYDENDLACDVRAEGFLSLHATISSPTRSFNTCGLPGRDVYVSSLDGNGRSLGTTVYAEARPEGYGGYWISTPGYTTPGYSPNLWATSSRSGALRNGAGVARATPGSPARPR